METVSDVARMFIDLDPPEFPENGDVWVRLGEWRVWKSDEKNQRGQWEPAWPPGYPKIGKRKGHKRKRDRSYIDGQGIVLSDSPKE